MQPQATIKKQDEELQIVYAEVYVPMVPDSHNEFMSVDSVRLAGHGFLKNLNVHNVDKMHDNVLTGACVVESFIARKGDPDFIEGAWVVGIHIPDPALWLDAKEGRLNGLSLQALVTKTPTTLEMEVPEYVEGGTDMAQGHSHTFKVHFSNDGAFTGGRTGITDGHFHDITKGTSTDGADGHTHRFDFVELWVA